MKSTRTRHQFCSVLARTLTTWLPSAPRGGRHQWINVCYHCIWDVGIAAWSIGDNCFKLQSALSIAIQNWLLLSRRCCRCALNRLSAHNNTARLPLFRFQIGFLPSQVASFFFRNVSFRMLSINFLLLPVHHLVTASRSAALDRDLSLPPPSNGT